MASRPVVQQQNRAEAGPGDVKQKNTAPKGRRALGDIGNLVTIRGVDGKPLPQVSRPVTRSFCAQLLANAQAAAAENKKSVALNVGGAKGIKGAEARKPAQKKVTVKPKPENVNVISSDTEKENKNENTQNKKRSGEGSSRKKAPTLTSVLTARSKAACGQVDKAKVQMNNKKLSPVPRDMWHGGSGSGSKRAPSSLFPC
ncbi:unnamed protein product [Ilex paraguariensis]|uniref:Uncharacterized protein n=1 Tax=Ilex paraguariensis TaxID=185542 RepID=A0ABC8SBX3_9AQUA